MARVWYMNRYSIKIIKYFLENLDYRHSGMKVRSNFLAKLFPTRDVHHQWEILVHWGKIFSERARAFLMAKEISNPRFLEILSDKKSLALNLSTYHLEC